MRDEIEIRDEIINTIETMRNRTVQRLPGRDFETRELVVQGDMLLNIWADIKMANEKLDELMANDRERD